MQPVAVGCGNLDVALETAGNIDHPELWNHLAQQALLQGMFNSIKWLRDMFANILLHQVVEKAYQHMRNFNHLSFLYLAASTLDKLVKLQKIADMRGNKISKFHNALYVRTCINVLQMSGYVSKI